MENYESQEIIGEGTYGIVRKCVNKATRQTVAIKKFKDEQINPNLLREIQLIKTLKHENIVNLEEIFLEKSKIHVVMEYMHSSLLKELESTENGIKREIVQKYMIQLLKSLEYLHSQNPIIIHRDIKPENLLISENGVLKLADFGFARKLTSSHDIDNLHKSMIKKKFRKHHRHSKQKSADSVIEFKKNLHGGEHSGILSEYVATRWYKSPEILVGDKKYNEKCDIWAVGCLLVEMLTKKVLFEGKSDVDMLKKICLVCGELTERQKTIFNENPKFRRLRKDILIEISPKNRNTNKKDEKKTEEEEEKEEGGGGNNNNNNRPKSSQLSISSLENFNIPKDILNFLGNCIKIDPKERLSASELLNHHFLKGMYSNWYQNEFVKLLEKDKISKKINSQMNKFILNKTKKGGGKERKKLINKTITSFSNYKKREKEKQQTNNLPKIKRKNQLIIPINANSSSYALDRRKNSFIQYSKSLGKPLPVSHQSSPITIPFNNSDKAEKGRDGRDGRDGGGKFQFSKSYGSPKSERNGLIEKKKNYLSYFGKNNRNKKGKGKGKGGVMTMTGIGSKKKKLNFLEVSPKWGERKSANFSVEGKNIVVDDNNNNPATSSGLSSNSPFSKKKKKNQLLVAKKNCSSIIDSSTTPKKKKVYKFGNFLPSLKGGGGERKSNKKKNNLFRSFSITNEIRSKKINHNPLRNSQTSEYLGGLDIDDPQKEEEYEEDDEDDEQKDVRLEKIKADYEKLSLNCSIESGGVGGGTGSIFEGSQTDSLSLTFSDSSLQDELEIQSIHEKNLFFMNEKKEKLSSSENHGEHSHNKATNPGKYRRKKEKKRKKRKFHEKSSSLNSVESLEHKYGRIIMETEISEQEENEEENENMINEVPKKRRSFLSSEIGNEENLDVHVHDSKKMKDTSNSTIKSLELDNLPNVNEHQDEDEDNDRENISISIESSVFRDSISSGDDFFLNSSHYDSVTQNEKNFYKNKFSKKRHF